MDEMEGVTSGGRPGQENPGKPGGSPRECEITSKGHPCNGAKGEDGHSYESWRRKVPDTEESPHSKGAVSRQGPVAKISRHSRRRSLDGSLHSRLKENGHLEGKAMARLSRPQGRREDKPDSTRTGYQDRPGLAHPRSPLNLKRKAPRSPVKTTDPKCSQDSPACIPTSRKRRRQHPPPEAPEPLEFLVSSLFNQVGALEVGLDELRTPGGAFLPVATSGRQIDVSQRAWLSWQLAHTGANLHWALAQLDTLLALHPGSPASSQR